MGQIVITEFIDDEAVATLCSLHDVVYDPTLGDDRARLLPLLRACDALIVRNRTTVDALLLDEAPTLAVIGRLGVGLDNIDLEACHTRGIAVRRAVGANADAVAEYVIGALLVLTRGAFLSTARMVRGEWPRTELSGLEVRGRTMGLVGFGDVARRVAVQAAALAMEVVAYDPSYRTLTPCGRPPGRSSFVTFSRRAMRSASTFR